MNKFIMDRILRSPEDGGGSGAASEGGGALDSGPAAPSDREAKLESRLEQLSTQLSGFMSKAQKQESDGASMRAENVVRAAIAKGEQELNAAEAVLAKAFDDGEGAVIAKAQRDVAQKAARLERINAEADQVRRDLKNQTERRSGGSTSGDLDTTNLDNWKTKHASWYGVDKEMTKAAHEIDGQIRDAGVIAAGTQEYFSAVDRQMSARFPDKLAGSPQTGSRSSGTGAPAGGNAGGQRIAASVADGYRRMGINIDDPKVAARMIANRQKAVEKGFLPAQPVTAKVLTR